MTCPKASVTNYGYTLCNIQEGRRSHVKCQIILWVKISEISINFAYSMLCYRNLLRIRGNSTVRALDSRLVRLTSSADLQGSYNCSDETL